MQTVSRQIAGAKNLMASYAGRGMAGDFRGLAADAKKDLKRAGRSGQFAGVDQLVPLALSIVLLAIVVGLGALILSEMDNTTSDTDATNVLTTGIDAMTDFADFFTIIVVVSVAAVIFLLLRVVRRSGMAAGR